MHNHYHRLNWPGTGPHVVTLRGPGLKNRGYLQGSVAEDSRSGKGKFFIFPDLVKIQTPQTTRANPILAPRVYAGTTLSVYCTTNRKDYANSLDSAFWKKPMSMKMEHPDFWVWPGVQLAGARHAPGQSRAGVCQHIPEPAEPVAGDSRSRARTRTCTKVRVLEPKSRIEPNSRSGRHVNFKRIETPGHGDCWLQVCLLGKNH